MNLMVPFGAGVRIRLPRAFWTALVVSLCVHLLVLATPIIGEAVGQPESGRRIDARLPAVASPVAEPMRKALSPARPAHAPERLVEKHVQHALTQGAMPLATLPAESGRSSMTADERVASEVATPSLAMVSALPPERTPLEPIALLTAAGRPAENLWPARGEIVFDVFRGDGNFRLGTTTHRWHHENGRYSMEARVETTGLVALFKTVDYIQRSEGRVLPQGLQPSSFSVERGGKRREWSEFNWKAGRVKLVKDGKARDAELARGDQDVLSLWHQLSLVEGWSGGIVLNVVTGKSAAQTRVEALGSESIEVSAGRFETSHLRATAIDGSLVLDIWYALDRHMVPIRIRMQDKKGEVLDQRARSITLGDAAPRGGQV